jgi:hypothetical protein
MIAITRRNFIKYSFISLITSYLPLRVYGEEPDDEKIFLEKIKLAQNKGLINKPLGKIIPVIGKSFKGTPYVADTLDSSGREALITNLHGLDCWTFFENTIVISRLVRKGKKSFQDYKKELEFIRYRGGLRTDYISRLHYFIDWIFDNSEKGVVKDINMELGGVKLNKKIDFMTTHRTSYPPLSSDKAFNELKIVEENINSREHYYVPTELLPDIETKLVPGDIIGLMTTIEGLDVSHTGLIYKIDGLSHILDASSSIGYVDVSSETLYDYLSKSGKSGIIIARPI